MIIRERISIILVAWLILPFFSRFASADEPRTRYEFTSKNGKYRFALVDQKQGRWNLIDVATNKAKYSIIDDVKRFHLSKAKNIKPDVIYGFMGEFGSQTIWIDDTGKFIVVFNDWPEDDDGLPVFRFYENGKLKTNYSISDFLKDKCNVSRSVSHIQWILGKHTFGRQKLSFITTELMTFVIDLASGKILHKGLVSWVDKNTSLFYGKIKKISERVYEIDVIRTVLGEIPSNGKVRFDVGPPDEPLSKWLAQVNYSAVLIKNGKLDPHTKNLEWIIYNACN